MNLIFNNSMILKITQKIIYDIDGTINFGFNKLLLTPQNN